jgi:hypothetical protein
MWIGEPLDAVQKSHSILVLASMIQSILVKPRRDGMSQKAKSICRSSPRRKCVVFKVCPLGGWENLALIQTGQMVLSLGNGFWGRP